MDALNRLIEKKTQVEKKIETATGDCSGLLKRWLELDRLIDDSVYQ